MTHVLIAEDKYESRYLLKVLLEGDSYRVTETSNGEEALATARKAPPDVIISDVLMPKLDGFELCRQWMSDETLCDIPFIFYSATYTTNEDIKLALSLGAKRYIIKPQESKILLAELQQVLHECCSTPEHPRPTLPDDTAFHTQHDAAMARKLRDKIEELEEANLKLRTSEEKYRGIRRATWRAMRIASEVAQALGRGQRDVTIFRRKWAVATSPVSHLRAEAIAKVTRTSEAKIVVEERSGVGPWMGQLSNEY